MRFEDLPQRLAGLPEGPWTQWPSDVLAAQYNARATVRDFDAEMAAYVQHSARMQALPQRRAALAYGAHADEVLDLFPVHGHPEAPLMVFIHGGYWRALSVRESVFMAESLNAQGVAMASINYTLAPEATLHQIVDQCARAVQWLHTHGHGVGVAPSHAVLAGSSAGAHLAAQLLAHDGALQRSLPTHWLRAGVLVSGLFDLAPIAATTPNAWLQLSAADVQALSPVHHLPSADVALEVVVAETDTAAFKQQSLDYLHACRARGVRAHACEVAGRNHFNVILDWMDPHSVLSQRTLAHLRG